MKKNTYILICIMKHHLAKKDIFNTLLNGEIKDVK